MLNEPWQRIRNQVISSSKKEMNNNKLRQDLEKTYAFDLRILLMMR
jgi:hypothetical protein